MGVKYVRASTQYHVTSKLHHRLAGRDRLTVSVWARPDDTGGGVLVSAGTNGLVARHQLQLNFTSFPVAQMSSVNSAGTSAIATSPNTVPTGSWSHVFGRVNGTSLRSVVLNGDAEGTNTTAITANTHNELTIATRLNSGAAGFLYDGGIAHLAVWDDYLSLAAGQMLARGASPMSIRRDALVYYWPMTEGRGPLVDIVSGERAFSVNGPTTAIYAGRTIAGPPWRSARIYTFGPPAGGAITGTMAASEAADSASIAGQVVVQGALAASESGDTFAATGTVSAGPIAGTLSASEAGDTASIAGRVIVQGALAASEEADSFVATGTTYPVISTVGVIRIIAVDEGIRIGSSADGIRIS